MLKVHAMQCLKYTSCTV